MKITIIGYKNHALRLKSILNKLGYDKVVNYNYHTHWHHRDDSDVYFISSPNETHVEWIDKLKEYDKYIFCEKPPATNLEDIDKLEGLYNNKLYFNFNYRFTSLIKLAKDYMDTKELGKLLNINCISTHGLAFKESFQDNWRFKSDNLFSSIVGNLGIHYIDLVGYLCGNISHVNIKTESIVSDKLPDTTTLDIVNELCDVKVFLSYAAPFRNQITMLFDNGILELLDGKVTLQTPRDTVDKNGMFKPPDYMYLDVFNTSKEYYDDSLKSSIKYFMGCVENDEPISTEHYNQSISTTKKLLKGVTEYE
jgi:predicted dehydrogenase